MRIVSSGMVIACIAVQPFCCAMNYNRSVFVETSDQRVSIFEKSKINQSSVLSVLYAHQKKECPHLITIPGARRQRDTITAEDVRALRGLLDHEGDEIVPYLQALSPHTIIHCTHAAHVLGSPRQLFQVIDHLFGPDIKKCIGSTLMNSDVQAYLMKQIIKRGDDPCSSDQKDWAFCSDKQGSFFFIPPQLSSYEGAIVFDGINPFKLSAFVENGRETFVEVISRGRNYYVTGGNNEKDPAILWSVKKNTLVTLQKKILKDSGKITQMVFDRNERYLVVGSDHATRNLFLLQLEPFGAGKSYCLDGYNEHVAKVIIDSQGRYIVSAYNKVAYVVVWDIERQMSQTLYDDYRYPITTIAFSENGKQLWVCSGNIISLWQIDDGGNVTLSQTIYLTDADAIICRLLVNEQAKRIVVGTIDGKLHVLCMNTYKQIACCKGHKESPINAFVGNDEGTVVVSSTNEITDNLMVWDISTGECIAHLKGHSDIMALLFTRDMHYIISQSRFRMCLWSMCGDAEIKALQYIQNELAFLHTYELYNLYKKVKNGHVVEQSNSNWVSSLPIIAGVKEFVEKYLL